MRPPRQRSELPPKGRRAGDRAPTTIAEGDPRAVAKSGDPRAVVGRHATGPQADERRFVEDLFDGVELAEEEITLRTDLSDLIEETRSSAAPAPTTDTRREGSTPRLVDDTEQDFPLLGSVRGAGAVGPNTARGVGTPPAISPLDADGPGPSSAVRAQGPAVDWAPAVFADVTSPDSDDLDGEVERSAVDAPAAPRARGPVREPSGSVLLSEQEAYPPAYGTSGTVASSDPDERPLSVDAVREPIGPVILPEPRLTARGARARGRVNEVAAPAGGPCWSVEQAAGETTARGAVGQSDDQLEELVVDPHDDQDVFEYGPGQRASQRHRSGASASRQGRGWALDQLAADEQVRRVNNMPLLIALAVGAGFAGVMAYVATSRTHEADERVSTPEPRPLLSATSYAQEITRKHQHSGVVLEDRPGVATGADPDEKGAGLAPLTVATVSEADWQAEAQPELTPAPDPGEAPLPDTLPADPMGTMGTAPAQPPFSQLKMDMFRQALTAKTAVDFNSPRAPQAVQAQPMRAYAAVPSDGRAGLSAGPSAQGPALNVPSSSGGVGPGYGGPTYQDPTVSGMAQGYDQGYMEKMQEMSGAEHLQAARYREEARARNNDYSEYEGEPGHDRWQLGALQVPPRTPYELRAGAVIPGVMITGINSDVGGQVMAQVAQHVYDTATGDFLLIPQGSRLVGTYGSEVAYGQERVLVAWQRIVFPDGKALDIGAMPGADAAGYSGFQDRVNNHFLRIFAGAILLSAITAGVSMSNQGLWDYEPGGLTLGGALSRSLGQQLGSVSAELVRRNMNIAPTLEIRPGYRFNVVATKDLTFSRPYEAFDYEQRR